MNAATDSKPQMNHQTTLKQIGPMTLMSVGARTFVSDTDSLMFQVGNKRGSVEKVIVTLATDDTYTVRYVAMRKRDYEVLTDESQEMVYADSLARVVREMGDR